MNSINFSIGGDNSKFVSVARQTQAIGIRMAMRVNMQFGAMATAVGTFTAHMAEKGIHAFEELSHKISEGVTKAYELGGSLHELSEQTGIGAGKALILQEAFKLNGIEADKLRPTINRMQKVLGAAADGNKTAQRSFSGLGLEWRKLVKLSPDQQFQEIAQAISAIDDPTKRAAAAMKIFGKNGGELLALFANKTAISQASQEIGSAADILDSRSQVFDKISKKIQNMVPAKMTGLFVGIADALSDPLLALLEKLEGTDLLSKGQEIGKWVIDAAQFAIDAFFEVRKRIMEGQEGMAMMVGWAAEIANLLWDGFGRLGLLFQTMWQGAIYDSKMLVAGLTEGVVSMALDLQTALQFAFSQVVRFFDNAMGPVIDSIQAGLEYAVQKAMEGIAKIPILGKSLGLEGFKSESFEGIQKQKSDERRNRQSENLQSYGEMRSENYDKSGWMKGAMSFVENTKKSAAENMKKGNEVLAGALSEKSIKLVDPQIFYDAAADTRRQRESMLANQNIPQLSAMHPAAESSPKNLSTWEKLQQSTSDWQALQGGKFGDRTNATLGASPSLHTESLIGNGSEAKKAEAARAASEKAEKDKDKTPEGTNSRLDDLIGIISDAWS